MQHTLTPALEALLPKYLEHYDKLCLTTAPVDHAKAEDVLVRTYAALSERGLEGFSTKPIFAWVQSPLEGALLAAQWAKGDTNVTDEEVQAQAHYISFGSMEAYWIGLYAFIDEHMSDTKEKMAALTKEIAHECGPFWVFEGAAIMCERPSRIEVADGVLHCTTGKALEYPNGDGLYAFKGELKKSLIEVIMATRADTGEGAA